MRCRKNIGRVLAGVLAVGLLVSSMPSAVYATENESGTAVVAEQEEVVPEDIGEEAGQESAGTESAGKEDNESGEETADITDTTPEEEDEESQDETGYGNKDDEEKEKLETDDKFQSVEDESVISEDIDTSMMPLMGHATSGSCGAEGDNLIWSFNQYTGVLSINGTGKMEDYSGSFDHSWHHWCQERSIKEVVIAEGVTSIGSNAFYMCHSLVKATIPSSVQYIGEEAFNYCQSLTTVNIPSGVRLGRAVFAGCSSLETVNIPSGVCLSSAAFGGCKGLTTITIAGDVYLDDAAFSGCSSLTTVTIMDGNRDIRICKNTFADCKSLTNITIPDNVIAIGDGAFSGCSSLTDIKIPERVTSIGSGAFRGTGLIYVNFPDSVTAIGYENPFMDCIHLKEISVGENNLKYADVNGVLLNKGMTRLISYPVGKDGDFYSIPNSVSYVEYGAFYNSSLSGIGISNSEIYIYIAAKAFDECKKLSDVYYVGSESDWEKVTIHTRDSNAIYNQQTNQPIINAAVHYNSTGPDDPGDTPKPPVKPDPDITDDPTLIVRQRTFDFTDPGTVQLNWGWNYILNRNSSNYIHEVSTVALALSAAAERSKSDIESMLAGDNFGVDKVKSVNYDEATQEVNYPACTFAHKEINNGGKTEHIIIIVGRGTSTFTDFLTDLASAGDHFDEPASNVWRSFLGWLDTNDLSDKINSSNTKFLVTGHSLGGAVANRIAYRLTRDYGNSNVYAYTFGTPPTEGQSSTTVPNIFNVLCAGDQVPYAGVFTDGRYGNECWFEEFCAFPFPTDVFNNFDNHVVESYMRHLLNRHDNKFRTTRKSGGGWCPVDLRIYNSSGQLVGSVTNNVVDKENITDSVMIVLSGEDHDKKNFYFLIDDTYTIEFTGTSEGTLKYTIRDTYADKSRIDEKAFTNVTLTAGKKMTSSVSVWDKSDPAINIDDKIDTPQVQLLVLDEDGNAVKEVLPDGNGTEIPYTDSGDVLPEDIPTDGKIPEGLWIAGVKESYTYTGTAIKPEIRVYDGKKRLQPGQDYTASYKNNTKVNDAAKISTAPTITVKGKGNYAGSETATFRITAMNLSDSVVSAEDITVAYNKKVQKKVPVVTYNGKKLSANRDFTVSYPNGGEGAYKEVGTYDILLTAKSDGNFSGTKTVKCTITDNTLLGKVSVKKIPAQVYTGEAIEPELTVTYKGAPLVKDTDYSVSYTDNTEIGTAKAVLTGIGKYAGTKNVSFSITGTSLKGASVSGIENKIYNGNDQEQRFTVTLKGKALTEGTDYDVSYEKNKNVGKASVTIKGKGAYTGTIKKTFTVGKYNVAANADGRFEVKLEQDVVPYAKGGAKPSVTVRFRTGDEKWVTLAEGQDYTLSYRNHTAVNDGSKQNKLPAVTVKGKGSFSGTYGTALIYKIVAQDLGKLTLTAQDKTYQNKKNIYATKITITDLDGKALKIGTDYNKILTYFYANETTVNTAGNGTIVRAAGAFVDKNDIIPAGTILKVQADAKSGGNYKGTLTGEYRMTQAAITSASVSVPKQTYTGRAITLEKNQITVKIKGKQLDESQYEIVPTSYKNNVKKGTATVKIRGLDNYGGTKDVRFTIKAKGFLWWWR